MRKFVDLHLCPSVQDVDGVKRMITKCSELGYRVVGIPLTPDIGQEKVRQLQDICDSAKLDFVTRVDFFSKTPSELLYDLRRLRRRFEVVSVVCGSKPVARQAAKDRRVDLLSFSATDLRRRFFDHAEAELSSKALSSLEIDLAPLLSLTGRSRIRLFSRLRRELAIAKRFNVPVTVSSGATNEYLMRSPHDYAALTTLFDMPLSSALVCLSENPLGIVMRNREKLSPNYVAPGIRVVRRKKLVSPRKKTIPRN